MPTINCGISISEYLSLFHCAFNSEGSYGVVKTTIMACDTEGGMELMFLNFQMFQE